MRPASRPGSVSELDAGAAREYVREERVDVVAAVEACADAVADSWDGDWTTDASQVANRLEACLAEHDVLAVLPGVLVSAVDAAGGAMQASPVAAPPYVVVTSRGPMLRATLGDGRLVVRFGVFRVTDDGRYERSEDGDAVSVSVR
jgi:hypothetical protein